MKFVSMINHTIISIEDLVLEKYELVANFINYTL